MISKSVLFEEVCSKDFLPFSFGDRGYQDQLNDAISKTSLFCGVKVELVQLRSDVRVVWVTHDFSFMGGSLGCAEGEKLTRAFEYGHDNSLPVVVQCRSGGARMQEGTLSLMQMAKISVAVDALHKKGLPFISVLSDPTYGGVSASYAMQSDIKIAVTKDVRVGFAGPAVILNTMCEANQAIFDEKCPNDFQAASTVFENGQIDIILEDKGDAVIQQNHLEETIAVIASLLIKAPAASSLQLLAPEHPPQPEDSQHYVFNYTTSRRMDRPQTQDIIHQVFQSFVELSGDGKVGRDCCIRGGIASYPILENGSSCSCVVIVTAKGHTPTEMQKANYGMPSPHGYRTAMRLMRLAEKFQLPVITLVDTVGAWPTFECETLGQSEAIAANLTLMAGLRVPIVTVMVGEGGSGGALGLCMGNEIAMLSGGYFGVISPEGAASILGRYRDDKEKASQFPLDCQQLATAQCIYAHQLQQLGIVDHILWENEAETYLHFPRLQNQLRGFISSALARLLVLEPAQLVQQRYDKYRKMGQFALLDPTMRAQELARIKSITSAKPSRKAITSSTKAAVSVCPLLQHVAEEVVGGKMSLHRHKAPPSMQTLAEKLLAKTTATAISTSTAPVSALTSPASLSDDLVWAGLSAKAVLDRFGPSRLSEWVKQQSKSRVLLTDTTMRDAHQSLLATRVRTVDLLEGIKIANTTLADAFSLELWGGATFDVCMRFLDECPWERLRALRAMCPHICFQMLIRGANAVGYTSYPDNVVAEFVRLAALNGMDVFRIFDCFNIVDNMLVSIKAVLEANKVAEVCICYTGNVLTSPIYTLDYYAALAAEIQATGAHLLGIKDMAGLLRPLEVEPLLKAIRNAVGDSLPIHFHTHATSSCSLATCMEMARCGCDIIDFATASMADGTSQPSLNGFVAMLEGAPRSTGLSYLALEPYDVHWAAVRELYSPFESGMKSGSARVFEHQIPGGQYSNLLVQCQAMGLQGAQWEQVLNAYRDVNQLLGDIIKVTPSSKCVGDLALYLVTRGLTTADLLDEQKGTKVDFPESVVGLLRGELGFPHRGFPAEVERLVLKGGAISKLTVRPGLGLAAVDLQAYRAALMAQWGPTVSEEQAMSSLMYPKVFSDFMGRQRLKGPLLPQLPTLVYLYGLQPGQQFTMTVPRGSISHLLLNPPASLAASLTTDDEEPLSVRVDLQRVGPLQRGRRAVAFQVAVFHNGNVVEEQQVAQVADAGEAFHFEGPMADPAQPLNQLGSPMPGVVEKLLVEGGEGSAVSAGQVLCVVAAMKMEVKVTAPRDGVLVSVSVPGVGYRVVEGALLFTIR